MPHCRNTCDSVLSQWLRSCRLPRLLDAGLRCSHCLAHSMHDAAPQDRTRHHAPWSRTVLGNATQDAEWIQVMVRMAVCANSVQMAAASAGER